MQQDGNIIKPNPSEIDNLTAQIQAMSNEKFDKQDAILEKIHQFQQAVIQCQPKAHIFTSEDDYNSKKKPYIFNAGKRKGKFKNSTYRDKFFNKYHWTENSTLSEWIQACIDEAKLKIEQIKYKKQNYNSLDGDSPYQRQFRQLLTDREVTIASEDEIKKFDIVWYEFLEWYLNHELEVMQDFLKGTFQIKESEIIKGELKTEISKIVMNSVNKKNQVISEANKIKVNKLKVN